MKKHLHFFDLVAAIKSNQIKRQVKIKRMNFSFLLTLLGFLTIPSLSFAQNWQINNYVDCDLTVTLTCPGTGASQTINTYPGNWGQWDGAKIGQLKFTSIPCSCSDPTLTIQDNCQSPPSNLFSGPLSTLTSAPCTPTPPQTTCNYQVCCCNKIFPDCADMNKCFDIIVDFQNCTITFAKPAGCP